MRACFAGRHRTNAEFVSDLSNAILRRGEDREGVAAWIPHSTTTRWGAGR